MITLSYLLIGEIPFLPILFSGIAVALKTNIVNH